MRSLFNILAILLLISLVSCEKEEHVGNYGKDGNLKIVLKCAQMDGTGSTKSIDKLPNEGTGANYQVKDYWLLQYTKDGGEYVDKSARYVVVDEITSQQTGVMLPKENESYYCLFIANTHNPELNNQFENYKGSLASMLQFSKTVTDLDDTYNKTDEDLIMSGIAELKSNATELPCKLYRNIAKLTVTLNNLPNSDLKIVSINIKNVPGSISYADVLLRSAGLPGVNKAEAPFPQSHDVSFFDYKLDNINLTSGNEQSFVWYLPRNLRGTVQNVDAADNKNKYAPDQATYIEIFATSPDNAEIYRYRFYVGENPTTDFNVVPNTHYNIPITFVDKGSVVDSRVTDFSTVKLSGKSNCYIINPLPIEIQPVYHLPLSKILQFWGSEAAPDKIPSASTNWVAEVIWQDQNHQILEFVNASGSELNSESAFTFKVKPNAKGNVLVGVREAGSSDYLWSWHLWITDYNPDDYTQPWTENKYVYNVPGGEIHRYAGEFWEQNYKNMYIMDRNLGALSTKDEDGLSMISGFVYQYGRKDPFFPDYQTKKFDINGLEIENDITITNDKLQIYESVNSPNLCVVAAGDWAEPNPFNKEDYCWNAPANKKGMFDPCPDGWTLPYYDVFEIMYYKDGDKYKANCNAINTNGFELYVESEHKTYNIAYFPATGVRNVNTGILTNAGKIGSVHTLNIRDCKSKDCFPFYFNKNTKLITPENGARKSRAVSVRCIREKGYSNNGNNNYDDNKNEDYNDVAW